MIYGPESRGKTALLRQVFELLKGEGFSVVYKPLEKGEERLAAGGGIRGLVKEALRETSRLIGGPLAAVLTEAATTIVTRALDKKVALLADVVSLEDPDAVLKGKALIELNLIAEVWDREEWLWIDQRPRERPRAGNREALRLANPREAVRTALRHAQN